MDRAHYIGRFAPSPTGPMHLGSLVAALASYCDARLHDGTWLIRIEDVDAPRCDSRSTEHILSSLAQCGMVSDAPVVYQSSRHQAYESALQTLQERGLVFACGCTRREVADSGTAGADGAPVYPGTCRAGLGPGRNARSWRLRVADARIGFVDRAFGAMEQDLGREVGDFVLKRADGIFAYQLAVVVDDAQQGITDIVRGTDLLDSTARQIYLQQCLGLAAPRTLHVPVVVDAQGNKLSKQTAAPPIDTLAPLDGLLAAARHLGLSVGQPSSLAQFWESAVRCWADLDFAAWRRAGAVT